MPNASNLKLNSERTPKERKELARKAGKKSAQKRREKKMLKETLEIALKSGVTEDMPVLYNKLKNFSDLDKDHQSAVIVALIQRAESGDPAAVKLIAELMGELTNKIDMSVNTPVDESVKEMDAYFANKRKETSP